jgi:hypothetical protein
MQRHTGNDRPVPPDAIVLIDVGDGQQYADLARHFDWGPGAGPDAEGRILRYALLAERKR